MITKDNKTLGITCTLIAAVMYAIMALFVHMSIKHVPIATIMSFRFLLSFLIILPFCCNRKFNFKIEGKFKFLWRSITGIAALVCFFFTLRHMNVADATLLVNSTPIYVPIIVLMLTGIKTKGPIWLGIVISVIGVIFVINPANDFFNWSVLIGVLSGMLAAFSIVLLRILSKHNSTNSLLFYYFLIGTIVSGIAIPFFWHPFPLHDLWLLIGIGITGVLYQYLFSLALQYAQIRLVSPLFLSSVVISGVLAWAVLGQIPSWNMIVGATILFIGILVVILFTSRPSIAK